MVSNGWIKLYRTILTDAKVRQLSASRRWAFVAYLLIAQHEGRWRGYLTTEEGRNLTGTEKAALVGCGDRSGVLRAETDLLEAGLLVRTEGDRLKVKNYDKYQPRGVVEPVAKTQQAESPAVESVANVVAKPVANVVAETQQVSTESLTCKKIRSKEGKKGNISHSREFEIFYAAYPKSLRRAEAAEAWNARVAEGIEPDSLIKAAENYADYCRRAQTEERWIMYPSSFLGSKKRGYEEYLKPRQGGNGYGRDNSLSEQHAAHVQRQGDEQPTAIDDVSLMRSIESLERNRSIT